MNHHWGKLKKKNRGGDPVTFLTKLQLSAQLRVLFFLKRASNVWTSGRPHTYLHWAWKYLMRPCRKSTLFFTLISFTFSRYWSTGNRPTVEVTWQGHVTDGPWRRSPRTSAAGRGGALSPFPLRSRHRWTQSGSFRAAWRVPSSPSQSLPCRCYSNAEAPGGQWLLFLKYLNSLNTPVLIDLLSNYKEW